MEKKLKNVTKQKHISNVVAIFLEELENEIKKKNGLKIDNFGELVLTKTKSKKFFNVKENKVTISKGNNNFKFKLTKEIKKIIMTSLDKIKTFGE